MYNVKTALKWTIFYTNNETQSHKKVLKICISASSNTLFTSALKFIYNLSIIVLSQFSRYVDLRIMLKTFERAIQACHICI